MTSDRTSGCRRGTRGFTLLEVLVALAVLATALAAVVAAVSHQVRNVDGLTERTLAHWVAMNEITSRRLAGDWPAPGQREGETEMAGRQWHWRLAIADTEDTSVRRLEIEVTGEDETLVLSRETAYLGAPHG